MNYLNFSPIPDFKKHTTDIESLMHYLGENEIQSGEWDTLWETINRFTVLILSQQKHWNGTKRATKKVPYKMMRSDLQRLMYKLNLNTSRSVNAAEWGINVTQRLLDAAPKKLQYLNNTRYYEYVSVISEKLNDVESRCQHGHSLIFKLFRNYSEHRDMFRTGQFSLNEMAKHLKKFIIKYSPERS